MGHYKEIGPEIGWDSVRTRSLRNVPYASPYSTPKKIHRETAKNYRFQCIFTGYRFSRPANKTQNSTENVIFITHKHPTDIYSIAIYHILPVRLTATNSETNQRMAIRFRNSSTVPVDFSVFSEPVSFNRDSV